MKRLTVSCVGLILLVSITCISSTVLGFNKKDLHTHPFERYVFSAGVDKMVRLWNIETGVCEKVFEGHKNSVSSVRVCSDGRYFFSNCEDRRIKMWDIISGKCVMTLRWLERFVSSIAISPNSKYLAGSSSTGTLKIWQVRNKKGGVIKVLAKELYARGGAWSLAFSPSGKYLAAGTAQGVIFLYYSPSGSWRDGTVLKKCARHGKCITSVLFDKTGERLFTTGFDGCVCIWDIKNFTGGLKELRNIKKYALGSRMIVSIALNTNGIRMALCIRDQDPTVEGLILLDLESPYKSIRLEGHQGFVHAAQFSGNDTYLASCDSKKNFKIWDASNYTCVRTIKKHSTCSKCNKSNKFNNSKKCNCMCMYGLAFISLCEEKKEKILQEQKYCSRDAKERKKYMEQNCTDFKITMHNKKSLILSQLFLAQK